MKLVTFWLMDLAGRGFARATVLIAFQLVMGRHVTDREMEHHHLERLECLEQSG